MNRKTRQAIARIEVRANGEVVSRGTGTLIGPDIALTALHVVADRSADPPLPHAGEIWLCFPGGAVRASVVDGAFDASADWVLLRCDPPADTEPVELAHLDHSSGVWETFGFPDANAEDGMVQSGTVSNHEAVLGGVLALQLYSQQAAAGQGAPVHGLSGAPVLVHGYLVGHLRFALMKDQRTVAGTLYGCPLSALREQLEGPLLERVRVRRRAIPAESNRLMASVAVVVLALLLVGGGAWLRRSATNGSELNAVADLSAEVVLRPSVSVLDFRNLNGGEDLDWLATALGEVLTSGLGAGDELRVVRAGIRDLMRDVDLSTIDTWDALRWQQLGAVTTAEHFVTGSYFELDGGLVRVEVQLRSGGGEILLADAASGLTSGVFALVEQVCQGIRAKLAVGELNPEMALAVMASIPQDPMVARTYAQGLARLREYDVDFAKRRFEEAIAAQPESPLPYAGLARTLLYQGEFDAAAEAAGRAIELSGGLLASERSFIEATREKALGQFQEAVDIYRLRFDLFPDDLHLGLLLAGAQNSAGQARRALATTDALAALPGALGLHPTIFREAAIAQVQLGHPELARDEAERALLRAQELGSIALEASTFEVKAEALQALGEWEEGAIVLAEAQRLYASEGDELGVARTLEGRARLLRAQGDLKSASALFEEVEQAYRQLGDKAGEAAILLDRSLLAMDTGDLGSMRALAASSAQIYDQLGFVGEHGGAINSLAMAFHLEGNLEAAQTEYGRALEAFTTAERNDARAMVLRNLGELAYLGCRTEVAKSLHQDALALNRSLGARHNEAYDLYRLGLVALAQDLFVVAQQRFDEAEALFAELGARLGEAEVSIGRADLQVHTGEAEDALATARRAVEIFADAGARDLEALARLGATRALGVLGQAQAASEQVQAVRELAMHSVDVRVSLQLAGGEADLMRNQTPGPELETVRGLVERSLRRSEESELALYVLQLGRRAAMLELALGQRAEASSRLQNLVQRGGESGCALEVRLTREALQAEFSQAATSGLTPSTDLEERTAGID